MKLSDYGRGLSPSTLRNEIERVYSDLDNNKYNGAGNIIVDRKSRISRISLTNSIVGFGNNNDLVNIPDWHEIVPWLNTGTERTSCDQRNLKRFSARRRDGPIDGDYTLIADRYKRRPVYHGSGLPLDGEIVPFCPAWIHAETAEFEFKSEHCALASDSQGNVGGNKGGIYTFNDIDLVLNDVFVETSSEFKSIPTGKGVGVAAILTGVGIVFPVALIGAALVVSGVIVGGMTAADKVNYNQNKIKFSVGEFNVSFAGYLPKRSPQLTSG